MLAATDTGDYEAGLVPRAQDFVLVQVAGRLDAGEAGGLGGFEFFENGLARGGGIPDAFLEIAFHWFVH